MYGVKGKLLAWLENFLKSRSMRVELRGVLSERIEVLSGVPQGSVIGPLLFLLFVNELPQCIKNSMRMFADDTKVWCQITKMEDSLSLQNDLDSLADWSDKWLLRYNPDKCKVMHVGHKLNTKYLMVDGTRSAELTSIKLEKDLGVFVEDDLKPSTQCIRSAAKARRIIGMVRRTFRKLDMKDFLILYKTYIRPHIEFCIQPGLVTVPQQRYRSS